jgi:hypothetical protein
MSTQRHGPESKERRRIRQGVGLIAILALVAIGVFFIDTALRATSEGQRITVIAPSATGLAPGSEVWVAGRPVGRVLAVRLRPREGEGDNVVITAVLQRSAEAVLRADASAEVRASDLLEPVVVAIDPGVHREQAWRFGDTLRGPMRSIDRDTLLAYARTLLDAGRELAAESRRVRDVLEGGGGSLTPLLERPELVGGLSAALERLRTATASFPESSVGRLLRDTTVSEAFRRMQSRLETWRASPERAGAERALRDAVASLDGFETRLARMMLDLESGFGTAGRALADGELADQVAALRAQLDTLTDELMRDPSRWLRVRIF